MICSAKGILGRFLARLSRTTGYHLCVSWSFGITLLFAITWAHHWGMTEDADTFRTVMRLAYERPEWVPVLRAACATARTAEDFSGDFAGSWVLSKLKEQTGTGWLPGLRTLATYGLIEKSGESTRGGRRAYYRMPDRRGIETALQELERRNPRPEAEGGEPTG